ncbi:MAG: twin-arginine translocase TatA/TatE family subunit [Rhodospirillales bacterium]|jgi:sec-independent protein translocase protein TatA|nr:twin-arginine translocase TatA/TatE family subunit [Rhodospirillales bacterium]
MGEFSIWHWLVVLLVVMLLFGGGKVSGLMGDLAKGIKSFKAVMAEDDGTKTAKTPAAAPPSLEAGNPVPPAAAPAAPPAAVPAKPVATAEAKTESRQPVDHAS